MIDIYLEDLLGALLVQGYDRVDSFLYRCVIDKITRKKSKFRFYGKSDFEFFDETFNFDGFAYSMKDETLSFTPNEDLQEYIMSVDKIELLKEKLELFNSTGLPKFDTMFSSLELSLLNRYFPEENIIEHKEDKTISGVCRVLENN